MSSELPTGASEQDGGASVTALNRAATSQNEPVEGFLFVQEDIDFLLNFTRVQLLQLYGQPGQCLPSPRRQWPNAFVNVTLRRCGRLYASMGGATPSNLLTAIKEALLRATLDTRFGHSTLRADVPGIDIELWIEIARTILTGSPDEWAKSFRLGIDGIRIQCNGRQAYYKPSVPLTKNVDAAEKLFADLCRKAKLSETSWRDPSATMQSSRWIHLVSSKQGNRRLRLLREQHVWNRSPDAVWTACQSSLKRLLLVQKSDGMFGYLYHPFEDLWTEETNTVRQAGCSYAVCRAADSLRRFENQPMIVAAADRALYRLLSWAASLESPGFFIKEPNCKGVKGKLGTLALTLLASQYSPGRSYHLEAQRFVETILAVQDDSGAFRCSIGAHPENISSQNFFPGEALLALAFWAKHNFNPRISQCLSKAFSYYRAHFRNAPHSAFILWQVDAWTRLLKSVQHEEIECFGPTVDEMAAFIFEQIDWLLTLQYTIETKVDKEDYIGGFTVGRPPTFSSATYVEAIIRACDAAALIEDERRLDLYRNRALLGIEFLLRLQLTEETTFLFPRPDLSIGAFPRSFECFDIRADYDQHFFTACLSAIESTVLWA